MKHLAATPQNIARAKKFLRQKWADRAQEMGRQKPEDLSGACKFASMFAQAVFGGRIQGNWHHQYVKTNGLIVDLTDAAGVQCESPYRHDSRWFGNSEHRNSMRANEVRVQQWVEEFMSRHNPYSKKSRYRHSRLKSKSRFDKRSFRTIQIGKRGRLLRVGCPKGQWKRGRCSVGMKAQGVLTPKKYAKLLRITRARSFRRVAANGRKRRRNCC